MDAEERQIAEEFFQTVVWWDLVSPVETVTTYYSGTDTLFIDFILGGDTIVHPLDNNVSLKVSREDRKSVHGIMIDNFLSFALTGHVDSQGRNVTERLNEIWRREYTSQDE